MPDGNSSHRFPSLFWPIVLIGVGVIWLLINFQIIPAVNINYLWRFWPLVLIAIGLNILLGGARRPWTGSLIGLVMVAAVLVVLIASPSLDKTPGFITTPETFTVPLEKAESARINLDLASWSVVVQPERTPDLLFRADIGAPDIADVQTTGSEKEKMVTLSAVRQPGVGFLNLNLGADVRWKIGLTDQVPLDLRVDGASGSVQLNLAGLKLSNLVLDMASGSSLVELPESDTPYTVLVDSASGSVDLTLPENTSLELVLSTASGSVNLRLPSLSTAVRIEVMDDGSGSLSMPVDLPRISGDREMGVWEYPDYAKAEHKILIRILDRGSGSITLRP